MGRTMISRITTPEIQVKYVNLGDFGGTDPVEDMWTLEVSGPTYEYRDVLSRLGLRWDGARKTWGVDATLYRYNNARRNAEWVRNRKIQTAAYPQLVELAKAHNAKAREENAKLGPADSRQRVEVWQRVSRMIPRLEAAGIKIEHTAPGRYEVGESKVWVRGNTYPIRTSMVKHGFRWDGARKAWVIPGPEFFVVGDKWMAEMMRALPEAPPAPAAVAVFSNMSDAELSEWVVDHEDMENITQDGEISLAAGIAKTKTVLRRMTPEDQEQYYNRAVRGRRAGAVPPHDPRRPMNNPTIIIAGVKYVLSTYWTGMMDDISDEIPESPWKYLWVYDTDRQNLAMWRVSTGESKVREPARTEAGTIKMLEKKGQLNRVDNAQFRRIEAEMSMREDVYMESLESW